VTADLAAWAAEQAAKLPPLTDTEAAGAGRIAAELDQRRADPDDQQSAAS